MWYVRRLPLRSVHCSSTHWYILQTIICSSFGATTLLGRQLSVYGIVKGTYNDETMRAVHPDTQIL